VSQSDGRSVVAWQVRASPSTVPNGCVLGQAFPWAMANSAEGQGPLWTLQFGNVAVDQPTGLLPNATFDVFPNIVCQHRS
jgi:hypothetical protein